MLARKWVVRSWVSYLVVLVQHMRLVVSGKSNRLWVDRKDSTSRTRRVNERPTRSSDVGRSCSSRSRRRRLCGHNF